MPYFDDLALSSSYLKLYHTCKVLTEVVDQCPVGTFIAGYGLHLLMGAHRAAVIRPQVRDEFQSFGKGLPPYDFFFIYRSIISFAVIDICHPVWSVLSHFP